MFPTARQSRLTLSLTALFALALQASAQQVASDTKPAGTAPATSEEEVVALSPFKVSTDKDQGYKATNATSGTRLNSAIKDLPMPISVITQEFIRDTGAGDLRQSLKYSSGVMLQSQNDQGTPGGAYQGPGGVNNPEGATANKSQTSFKIRGYITDVVLRDGFRRQNSTDSINISRIEVVFGPSALLYGIGSFGGIVNYVPKAPQSKQQGEFTASLGSYGFKRATLDVTGPVSKTWSLNYRLTGAYQDTNSYTDFNTEQHTFISPSISFKPTKTTTVDIDFETGQQDQSGVGFQRVRAMANVGINSDQNEHADFYTVPGTNPLTYRWSGPDTYMNTESSNFRAQLSQHFFEGMDLLIGYNRATSNFSSRDIYGNLSQNVGPASLRARVFFTTLNPTTGDSNLNAVNGYVDNVSLVYGWSTGDTKATRDQARAELSYKFKLFTESSKWMRVDNAFLLGHSEEKANSTYESTSTKTGTNNYKSPTDSKYIRFGTQGDGTADVAMAKNRGAYSTAWDQASYFVYQGKLIDDRITVVSGLRRDSSDNFVRGTDYVANTKSSVRSPKVKETTYQNGISLQINRFISAFALKAEGIQPNFDGNIDVNGNPLGPIMAKSKEYGVKIDLLDGKISGTISQFQIKRKGTPVSYWWAPTSNNIKFNPAKNIVYNVSNFSPGSVAGGSNGGNGAADSALTQWNAGVTAGAIYQKSGTWYVNASQTTGAAYLDAVFDYTKSHGMSWPGWLYNYDAETNNAWNDIASSKGEYVIGADSAKGWGTELTFTPTKNLQFVASYSHVERVIDSAGMFAKYPYPQDRWAVWNFPNTDWGLTGKPLSTVYTNKDDSSTWTGIGYGTGERQDDTPEHAVAVWAHYQFLDGSLKGLSVGLGSTYESPREYQSGITHGGGQRITDSKGNLVILKTPTRYNYDLMARYAFKLGGHDSSVQLNVANLLDDRKRYGLIYASPRTARLEFGYKF